MGRNPNIGSLLLKAPVLFLEHRSIMFMCKFVSFRGHNGILNKKNPAILYICLLICGYLIYPATWNTKELWCIIFLVTSKDPTSSFLLHFMFWARFPDAFTRLTSTLVRYYVHEAWLVYPFHILLSHDEEASSIGVATCYSKRLTLRKNNKRK